jgi:hypothetical protein
MFSTLYFFLRFLTTAIKPWSLLLSKFRIASKLDTPLHTVSLQGFRSFSGEIYLADETSIFFREIKTFVNKTLSFNNFFPTS